MYKEIDLCEAIFDITLEIYEWLEQNYDREGRPEFGILATNDSGVIRQTVIDWAKEFCLETAHKEWDGEYLEEIAKFVKRKLSQLPTNLD